MTRESGSVRINLLIQVFVVNRFEYRVRRADLIRNYNRAADRSDWLQAKRLRESLIVLDHLYADSKTSLKTGAAVSSSRAYTAS